MLNIYYGGEDCEKENFIFDNINPEKKTIILVPDQFSLQMESDALKYYKEKLGKTALINLMVADFSSLGHKVVKASNGKEPELIDKYGRHMLLSVLINKLADDGQLNVYENMKGRNSFTEKTNQLISEMKRYGINPKDLEGAKAKTDSFLKLKLADIFNIFTEYENSIEGRFTDSEDYIKFYGELMSKSQLIKGATIWIYGFDTFTPLNIGVINEILKGADCVNVILTATQKVEKTESLICDARILTTGEGEGLFDIIWQVVNNLKELDQNASINPISGYQRESIWTDNVISMITLVEASNIYAEADRVAAHIVELVREKDYKYGDITVICNDMDVRGGILKRTFDRWNIPAFADRKRKVLHQPVVKFLLSFLDVIANGYEGDSIMKMVNAGLMGWSRSDEELLINYTNEAKIRGSKWKKEFSWAGVDGHTIRYSEEDLTRLNEMRQFIVEIVEDAKNEIGRRNAAGEKVKGLYAFLENKFEIKNRIEELIEKQNELMLLEGAAETAQSWNMICGIFTQVLRVIGEEHISNIQLRDILKSGLEEMEIGLVPTSTDCVIIGTLQRTRVSKTRSLIVTAANEGILPLEGMGTGLLTEKELEALEELKLNIAKKEDVRRMEEQLAIYRTFSLPKCELYVTYSLADEGGKSASPSGVFTVLKDMTKAHHKVLGDLGAEDITEKITSQSGTLPFMASAMQSFLETGNIDDIWLHSINWYFANDAEAMSKIRQGLYFDNKMEALSKDMADSLYFGDLEKIYASASRLELYSSCPFSHFIKYGLKPEEGRKFEIDSRSKGDIYHKTLQVLSKNLMPEENKSVTDETSRWMTISEEECREQVEEILRNETKDYREGVYSKDTEGQLQLERVIETCGDIAWAMIGQVRKSETKKMYFEEPFGLTSSRLKPIEIDLDGGKKAVLSGKIDRIDIIDVNREECSGEAVRIIDYKTGNNKINRQHMEEGYKLQLMIYMNAVSRPQKEASQSEAEIGPEPAGVFYFKINDYEEKSDGTPDKKGDSLEERIAKACKLEGILVNDERIIQSMDKTLKIGMSSDAVPVKIDKSGAMGKSGTGELMSGEEFKDLCEKTLQHVERICHEIQEGRIDIAPKIENYSSTAQYTTKSCTYCDYKSICLFDTSFRQCRYQKV